MQPSFAALLAEKEEGVAEANERVRGSSGKAGSNVEIDLMVRREFVRGSKVKELARATALGEIAGILNEGIP